MTKNVKGNVCTDTWPQSWLIKASNLMWFVLVTLSLALMVGFYFRVVYALWFKRNNENSLGHQQRVSVNKGSYM